MRQGQITKGDRVQLKKDRAVAYGMPTDNLYFKVSGVRPDKRYKRDWIYLEGVDGVFRDTDFCKVFDGALIERTLERAREVDEFYRQKRARDEQVR